MDPLTTSLVNSSFKSIGATPGGESAFARSFYANLFAAHPEIRQYFPEAMDLQRDRLIRAVGYVVERLYAPETVLPLLAQLGRGHRKCDITDDHYQAVGNHWSPHWRAWPGPSCGPMRPHTRGTARSR